MRPALRHARAHDYKHLIERWQAVADRAGLRLSRYARAAGYPIYCVRSLRGRLPKTAVPCVYLSAGIHGDEAASTEGLLAWASTNTAFLRRADVLIFPCLNPWGLVNNCRLDRDGRDLNRAYNDDSVPQIAAQKKLLGARRFDLAIAVHEDYDAHGVYIYEVPGAQPHWGERLARAARRHVPTDRRRMIEGRAARGGIVRRAIKPELMPSWPEAFILYFAHCRRVFTVETPSEIHLDARVAAHVAVLKEAVTLCQAEVEERGRPGPGRKK